MSAARATHKDLAPTEVKLLILSQHDIRRRNRGARAIHLMV